MHIVYLVGMCGSLVVLICLTAVLCCQYSRCTLLVKYTYSNCRQIAINTLLFFVSTGLYLHYQDRATIAAYYSLQEEVSQSVQVSVVADCSRPLLASSTDTWSCCPLLCCGIIMLNNHRFMCWLCCLQIIMFVICAL